MENPIVVSNYFIQRSFDTGIPLTPMKLVKLVYIAHGWYLGLTGKPLLNEPVEAWQYGPVVKSVYDQFKHFGSSPITSFANNARIVEDSDIKQFLNKVWDVYKGYNAIQLSSLTHQLNTPWYQVWNNMNGKISKSAIIGNDLIKEHYKTKIPVQPASI